MANFVTTTGKLINEKGAVVGNAAPGTKGTFTEGVAPLSAAGSASSTKLSTSSNNPHDAPGYAPATDPTSSVNMKGAPATTLLKSPINTATGAPADQANIAQPAPAIPNSTQATPQQVQQVADATKSVQGMSQQIGDQMKQGLATTKASGVQAPNTQGQATPTVQSNLPAQQYDPTYVDQSLEQEPVYAKLLDSFAEMMSPPKQAESLVSQYDALRKSSGIDAINTELINTKRVIDGTEDDIRSEVTAANGFATDSQVMALASARNKTLIKNYNALLDTRNSLNEQINTSLQLAGEDRQYAQQRMNQQLQVMDKIMEYRDKFQNNAKENYNNIIKAVGYQGLLQSTGGDLYQTSLIEKTLGLGSGGLQKLANTPVKLSEMDQADLAYKKAQTADIYSQIKDRNKPFDPNAPSTKPLTAAQQTALSYANRISDANTIIDNLGSKFTAPINSLTQYLPNQLKSADRQKYEQAQANFVNAVLRKESGAAISPSEFANAKTQYFPQPGDSSDVIAQKKANRDRTLANLRREGGQGETSSQSNIIIAPDGTEVEITD